ncbi:MAG: Coenzyme F420 hydrogenase/dehydrogenase, beta subunit C-terminal domain [Proteobacteria bacterium]|nr:Coenzyme F420 hydrogenase/dehydrogenase, beta subunit C-terminal domain [Pseudomonadota bacterium]
MVAEACKKHLEISKAGFEALTRVIEFSCSACGLCVSLCPTEAIAMQNNVPTLVGQCTKCGFCYQGCPRSFFPLGKVKERFFGAEQSEVETRVGRCVDRFTARSLTDEIFDRGANGGTATALLYYLLEKNIVDAVLHLGKIHEDCCICHHAKTIISTRPEETLRGSKSKNQISPVLHDLKKVAEYPRYAVVGLSCHVQALRKLQVIRDDPELKEIFKGLAKTAEKLLQNLKFVIAINCFSNTKYGGIDKIYQKLGIREEDVIKYAEDTKKSLYQFLNEGKNFFWYVQDNIMTRDGKFFPFKYTDYLEDVIFMGCMVCPSFIGCKEADASIGITASEIKVSEFGYNSVLVRNPELGAIFSAMAAEGKLLKRPMWDNRGTYMRKFVERVLPSNDLMNMSGYVATGKWNPSEDLFKSASSAHNARIMGLQRLFLAQTVKRKMMFEPAMKALKACGKLATEIL